MPSRRIVRDVNEAARDIARRKMRTKAFLTFESAVDRSLSRMSLANGGFGQQRRQESCRIRVKIDASGWRSTMARAERRAPKPDRRAASAGLTTSLINNPP
jgi:hypothetical protein